MSRSPRRHVGAGAPRSPKGVPAHTRRGRVAAGGPRLVLLPGGLDLDKLAAASRRVISVLPSSGSLGLRTVGLLARLPADDLAVTVALLVEQGWIMETRGERLAVELTQSAQAVRRRQPARCALIRASVSPTGDKPTSVAVA